MDNAAPQTYRPDIAAFVTGRNHCAIFAAASTMRKSDIVAMHIDSIWTHDLHAAYALDDTRWSIKRDGQTRHFGVGVFAVWNSDGQNPECHAMGHSGRISVSELASYASDEEKHARVWLGGTTPAQSEQAKSIAPYLDGAEVTRRSFVHPHVSDSRWTDSGGWAPRCAPRGV